jgi:hypothetical protein
MNHRPPAPSRAARLIAGAALACTACVAAAGSSATPPVSTPGTRATPGPDTPPRTGDYEVLGIGESTIHARCTEGGWVFVSRHGDRESPAAARRQLDAQHLPPDRDAAVREACREVDFSK